MNIYGLGKCYYNCYINQYYTDIDIIFSDLNKAIAYTINKCKDSNYSYKIYQYILNDPLSKKKTNKRIL